MVTHLCGVSPIMTSQRWTGRSLVTLSARDKPGSPTLPCGCLEAAKSTLLKSLGADGFERSNFFARLPLYTCNRGLGGRLSIRRT